MNLSERVKNILLSPSAEWQKISQESTSVTSLYKGYVLPLAAIGPVATFIGMAMIGVTLPFTAATFRVPVGQALAQGIVSYALALISVFVLALIINALAPTFGGQKSNEQALKVAVYSSTAAWVAAIFTLIPALSVLSLLGLYSLYLLYLGLPLLMQSPKEKALGYTAVVVVCAIVLSVVVGTIAAAFVSYPTAGMRFGAPTVQ